MSTIEIKKPAKIALKNAIFSLANILRNWALYAFDMALCGIALISAYYLHAGNSNLLQNTESITYAGVIFVVVCAIVFPTMGLYGRQWRYASIVDVIAISKAVLLASTIFLLLAYLIDGIRAFPRSVIAIEIPLLACLLFATRLSFRLDDLRTFSNRQKKSVSAHESVVPVLLAGAGNAGDIYLRALQRDENCNYVPVGFLDNDVANQGLTLRGVPVLGRFGEFEAAVQMLAARGDRPRHLIFTEIKPGSDERATELLIEKAEKLGITVSRLASPTELRSTHKSNKYELRPIELTDLLQRPQSALDLGALERLIHGRRILITGAGGSIGSELTKQIHALGPSEIILIECNELNMYSIGLELKELESDVAVYSYLANIRDQSRVKKIFDLHQPQLVFHAAALKHVPIVELNPCEGILTNVIGTMNIANAAKQVHALAMVQVSTDKVVNSTGLMGATKRLAELYCQALDLEGISSDDGTRFMTVRFGNVLGSSGSLIPLFQRQLARGGPLTVTHPEMTRFFMTVREAVELTLQASAYGLEKCVGQGEIFVLDMGEPVKIIDVARRMIRLAGLTPDEDVEIEIIGRRPGEKLFEELFDESERRVESDIPGVLGAVPTPVSIHTLRGCFAKLQRLAKNGDNERLFATIQTILPNYVPSEFAKKTPSTHLDAKVDNDNFSHVAKSGEVFDESRPFENKNAPIIVLQRRHSRHMRAKLRNPIVGPPESSVEQRPG